jgi:hypothetical protein
MLERRMLERRMLERRMLEYWDLGDADRPAEQLLP